MKKSFLCLAAASLLFSSSSFASDEGKVTFGLEMAPAVTWFSANDHPEVESDGAKMKFNGGVVVYFNYGNENKYSVFTGLNYNSYGGYLKGDLNSAVNNGSLTTSANAAAYMAELQSSRERLKYNFGEFEIPVGVRFRTGSFGKWRFAAHMNLGLAITVYGHATMKDYAGIYDNYKGDTYSYKPMRLRGTYGFAVGAEYDLDAVVLTGKIRYKGSMTNMYFYREGMFNPAASLNVADKEDRIYSENVTFLPHIIELAIGVLF